MEGNPQAGQLVRQQGSSREQPGFALTFSLDNSRLNGLICCFKVSDQLFAKTEVLLCQDIYSFV